MIIYRLPPLPPTSPRSLGCFDVRRLVVGLKGPGGPGRSREDANGDTREAVGLLERLEARIPRGLGGPGGPGRYRENATGDSRPAVALLERLEARIPRGWGGPGGPGSLKLEA